MTIGVTAEFDVLELEPPPNFLAGLKKRESQLQVLPDVAVEAMRIARDPDCSISKYAEVVGRDVKLATEILTATNSAAYNPTTPIVNLKQAVVRLGLQVCQNLILASSISSMMRRISQQQERISFVLWQHSYITALIATSLNQLLRLGFHGEEFTAGLIHDLGRTILAVAEPKQFAAIDPLDFIESSDQLIREQAVLGTDHCRFGAWYALQQHLPAPLPEIILYHHHPEHASNSPCLTSLVAVADHMANHLQRFNVAKEYDPLGNPYVPILARFCESPFGERFAKESLRLMDKAFLDAAEIISPS